MHAVAPVIIGRMVEINGQAGPPKGPTPESGMSNERSSPDVSVIPACVAVGGRSRDPVRRFPRDAFGSLGVAELERALRFACEIGIDHVDRLEASL